MKKVLLNLFVYLLCFFIFSNIYFSFFAEIFNSEHIIFPYAIYPFDICSLYPQTWSFIKKAYCIVFAICYTIIHFSIVIKLSKFSHIKNIKLFNFNARKISEKFKNLSSKTDISNSDNNLRLKIGCLDSNIPIYISEKGLFQNILITGTIGSGKTSSAMYPFTKQLVAYNSTNSEKKLGILILDVKGNYIKEVQKYANLYNRSNDVITINLSGKIKYNPLDKPELKPAVLANRLKTILTLFSKNNSESYWLDKAEQILSEAIKFCRLYNNNYVTFTELHKLVLFPEYFEEKIVHLKKLFNQSYFNQEQVYDLISCIDFFQKEFFSLDARTLSILRSEISRITNIFVSDYQISNTFCPSKDSINFSGFEDCLENGKIVVLQMNISEYRNLSKIIATYLKLDFQTAVMKQLSSTKVRMSAFISDEYHEYVSETDADFFSECREAKCINIIATQSYTSLINSLKNESSVKIILQSLINKLWFRTDDIFTIEEAQKQIGKLEKEKTSITISENAKKTDFNVFTNSLISRDSNISESYNTYTQNDFKYDTNFFSQNLKTFECLAFLSDGMSILEPQKLTMLPHFKDFS